MLNAMVATSLTTILLVVSVPPALMLVLNRVTGKRCVLRNDSTFKHQPSHLHRYCRRPLSGLRNRFPFAGLLEFVFISSRFVTLSLRMGRGVAGSRVNL